MDKIYRNSIISSYLKIAVFFLLPFLGFSQTYQLTGKTQDSLQNPIPNTKIIATPQVNDANITFAISSLEGDYKLKLENNILYKIAITHLGYSKITDTVTLTKILKETAETLQCISIKDEKNLYLRLTRIKLLDYLT